MDFLMQDVRFAWRTLRKNPLISAIAVVCLAVGIATNTTMFSCLNAIVLRPLPFENPEQLIVARDGFPGTRGRSSISYPTFQDWRSQSRSFEGLAALGSRSLTITEGEEPERLLGSLISANLFPLLGVAPQIGRQFREDEDKPGAAGVVLISDGVWRRRYGADSSVVGRVISINNLPYTVVGIMPPRFRFPETSD
ncbi:MAG TPA: ABC transporter permease, partial [Gemmatimonadaceae bacterium]|nr:ABC transporter permease [Gemmatimonadaceae bacterium]